jgi:hypothetical protein
MRGKRRKLLESNDLEDFEDALRCELEECLRENAAFMAATTRREQIGHACRILHEEHFPKVPYSVIGDILGGINSGTIIRDYKLWISQQNAVAPYGRKVKLPYQCVPQLVEWIDQHWYNHQPASFKQTREFIYETWGIQIMPNTLCHIISKIKELRSCLAKPMEDARLHVTEEDVYNWFVRLRDAIEGVPSAFVYNMDEMGHEEYADRKEKKCVVPSHVQGQVFYEVSRQGKRITLVACVASDGSFVRPNIIISRATYDDDIVLFGIKPGENIDIYSQSKAYMDKDIFYTWIRDSLIPDILEKRQRYRYEGPAYLILDNCSSHKGDNVNELCESCNLNLLWLPPHSSHFLQCLDVSLFGITKNNIRAINKTENVFVQTNHIVQIFNGFLSAAIPKNIIKSFQNSGISLKREGLATFCTVTPETVRLYEEGPGAAAELVKRYDRLADQARIAAEAEANPNIELVLDTAHYVENALEIIENL